MSSIFLTVAASGGAIVDVDGTFFIQLVVFLIMLVFLYLALFRPAIRMIEARREATVGTSEKARKMKSESDTLEAEFESRIIEVRKAAAVSREAALKASQEDARRLLIAARNDSHRAVEKAREEMAARSVEVREQLVGEVETMADMVASRILNRSVQE